MSIPKEPRQLMINLMYIVLTALLALNVSAEILNAFFQLDESLSQSNSLIHASNNKLEAAIQQQAEAYEQYEPLTIKAAQARSLTDQFLNQVEQIRSQLIEAAGGLDEQKIPKRHKDKDLTTRILIQQGKGDTLKNQMLFTRKGLLDLVESELHRKEMEFRLPLLPASPPSNAETQDWTTYTFQQLPVAAVLPILSKMENDAQVAETAILNYLLDQMSAEFVPDAFLPVVSADKSYIIQGEEYKGEIFLASYSSTASNIEVEVDGRPYPVRDGKAVFSSRPPKLGTQSHEVKIKLTNPITNEVESFIKRFSYEVGARAVTVSADKMNVFYVGVKNPVSIVAAGVPSATIQVKGEGVALRKVGASKYIAEPDQVGEVRVVVTGEGLPPTSFGFRVKRIPDPVMKMGRRLGGSISVSEIGVHPGIYPDLEGFDFEAKCQVTQFELVRVPKNGDVSIVDNKGGRFKKNAKRVLRLAKRNDVYYFDKIKVKCPGDNISRTVNSMIFNIK